MRQPHHGRNGSRHIGRLRERAAKILSSGFGFEVRPEDIQPVTGAYRTNQHHDVYRWELFTITGTGLPYVAGCWETLTEFVKHAAKEGFHVTEYQEIYAGKE